MARKQTATVLDQAPANSRGSAISALLADEEPRQENFHRVELELGPGLVVTGIRMKLLTEEQIAAQKSDKGDVIGFVDIQLGNRVWINSLKLYRSKGKAKAILLNPSQYNQKTQKWYNDVFFTREDREKILNKCRELVGIKVQQKQAANA